MIKKVVGMNRISGKSHIMNMTFGWIPGYLGKHPTGYMKSKQLSGYLDIYTISGPKINT